MTSTARDSDTPEQVGVIAAELGRLTQAQAHHAGEMRERLDSLAAGIEQAARANRAAFARIDGLKAVLEADRAERDAEREQLAELVEAVEAIPPELPGMPARMEAVEATDAEQEELRRRATWTAKVIVWLVPIVMGLLGSLAGWQLHATQVGRETDAELRTRVERAEADVQAHGIEDDEEHRRAATERRETAEALRELTGEIRSWRESQAEDVRAIGEGVRRLEVQVRRSR